MSFSSYSFVKHTKHINGLDALVDMVTNLLNINIQFIKCSSKLKMKENVNLMRKHRRKHYYDTTEPLAKKKHEELSPSQESAGISQCDVCDVS